MGSGVEATRRYVADNRAVLQRDIAVGSGRSLYGLSSVAGCQDSAQLGRVLHRRMPELLAEPAVPDERVAERVLEIMRGDPAMRCLDLHPRQQHSRLGRYEILGERRGAVPVIREMDIRRLDPPDR